MARFFIYIPGNDIADPKKLDGVGLSHLKPGANFITAPEGPDGARGVVISWPNTSRGPVAYLPAEQDWTECRGHWLGFTKGSPPTPRDLALPQQFEGISVPLGDGNSWLIPSAGKLPKKCERDDNGEWYFAVRDRFISYWNESCTGTRR